MSPRERAIRESAAKLQKLGEPDLAAKLLRLIARKRKPMRKPGMGPTRKEERAGRDKGRRLSRDEVYALVDARAGDLCEACRQPFTGSDPGEHDHMIRGSGNREKYQSAATVWKIHRSCHRARTHNRPLLVGGLVFSWSALERWHFEWTGLPVHPEIHRLWANREAKAEAFNGQHKER